MVKRGLNLLVSFVLAGLLTGCRVPAPAAVSPPTPSPSGPPAGSSTPLPRPTSTPSPMPSITPTFTPSPSPTPVRPVPAFDHILVFFFENKEFSTVIGNSKMPNYNRWAGEYTLLTEHYAILHPSLPNYIAFISGDTHGIDTNYPSGVIDAPSLPDLLEEKGLTWKTYQESMPAASHNQDTLSYVRKHNPFVFFKPIIEDEERCKRSIVPLSELENDLRDHTLPNFAFITPNLCNSAHDSYTDPLNCGLDRMDGWLDQWLNNLMSYWPVSQNGLIIVTWDEGQGDHGCCGIEPGGGRIPTVLISSKAKKGFLDNTPYTHYSMLKTIATAWDLPLLGRAAEAEQVLVEAPWIK